MTHLKPFFAVVFTLLFFNFHAYSASGIGFEISYHQVDSLKYDVDFVVYRYCGSVKLNTNFTTPYMVCQTSGYKKSLDWKIVSVQEIKTECDSIGGPCNPPNASFGGNGYERIVLRSTVDFTLSKFDSFYNNGCTSIRFEMEDCCRNSASTVGLGNTKMYTYAEVNLDIDGGNSSPSFTSPPILYGCCNQPVYYNVGAIDADDDSLSYALAEPLSAYGTGLKYAGSYAYYRPIDCYLPGSLKFPYNNPNANPPIGLHVNEKTGDLIFTPVKCDEYTTLVMEVTEWRKDTSTGKMLKVGVSRRDIDLQQRLCPNNNPPIIKSESFEYRACEGKFICISIETEDNVKVPPPPLPKPKGDSVFLAWNRGIPQGKFVVTQDTFESANFCWTPDSGSARSRPYQFVVYADDDHCGGVLRTQRTFQITVNPPSPDYALTIDSVTCGKFALKNSLSTAALSKLNFELMVKPILGTNVKAYFASNHTNYSKKPEDSIRMTRNGFYELTYTLECGKTIVDTLVVGDFSDMTTPSDIEICYDHGPLDLTKYDTAGNNGTWSCPANPKMVNSKGVFLTDSVPLLPSTQRFVIYYAIGSVANCGYLDSFDIRINPLPNVVLRDGKFCQNVETIDVKNDKIIAVPGGGTLALGRQKWSCVDCGGYKESDIIKDHGTGLPGAVQNFKLHIDSSVISLPGKAVDSLLIELEFRNVFGCTNRDTTTIYVHPTPTFKFDAVSQLCWNDGVVNLNELTKITIPNSKWSAIDAPGYAPADSFNVAMSDSFLNTTQTPRPSNSTDSIYKIHLLSEKGVCKFELDTAIKIKGVVTPKIDHRNFQARLGIGEPYAFCPSEFPFTLESYNGGVWSASDTSIVIADKLYPQKATRTNEVITIWNQLLNTNGCVGEDSVKIVFHDKPTLRINTDTSITWYASQMSLDVEATYANTPGILWVPLTGSTIDNTKAAKTTWRFSADRDTITRKILYAMTQESSANVCPFQDTTMVLMVHPTPCMDIEMDYTLSSKSLKLSPVNENMSSFRWEVDGKTYNGKNPTVDLSNASDTLVWVKLIATNQLGDTCVSYNKINVKNGSVTDLDQLISLYPNPVTEGFTIETTSNLIEATVEMYGSNGKLAHSTTLETNYVTCGSLAPGMYTIIVQTDTGQYLGRFVKE